MSKIRQIFPTKYITILICKCFKVGDKKMIKNNLKTIRMGEFYLSKRDFSKKLNIAEQQYLRYENGQANPSLEIAIKISIKLNRHVDDIWYME